MNVENALDIAVIRDLLAGSQFARDLRYVPEMDSTNRAAAEIPDGQWQDGTAIFTDHQTSGRGRRGRIWTSAPGRSILVSVLFSVPPGAAPHELLFVAGLSVADALVEAGVPARLKWPNDVHVGGRKIAGILSEFSEAAGSRRVVLGMGINVNVPPDELARYGGASSVLAETGKLASREKLAANLLFHLDMWYRCLTREPDRVFEDWTSRLDTIGAQVDVSGAAGTWSGTAVRVLRDGGLVVDKPGGERRIVYAADVSIRSTGGLQAP
jgi:BirA family transcriptional regulator, biotin operon repressor / biotin---[acetyl-CoA-carboxylase] ligase